MEPTKDPIIELIKDLAVGVQDRLLEFRADLDAHHAFQVYLRERADRLVIAFEVQDRMISGLYQRLDDISEKLNK